MAKILILAPTGFGKSTSILNIPEYGIEGLNPKETYVISATTKPLPGAGTKKLYPIIPNFTKGTTSSDLKDYRRIVLQGGPIANPGLAAHAITLLSTVSSIKNIVFDDMNYIMQDYYMAKSLSTGWDAPKKIGYDMGKIFEAMEKIGENKNFIAMAHFEEYPKADGRIGLRMKTTGKMVQEYVTPEGKFEIVLFGHSYFDETNKTPVKVFVTNDDGIYSTAKSPVGLFGKIYIPNDLGYVVRRVDEYYEDGIKEIFEEMDRLETRLEIPKTKTKTQPQSETTIKDEDESGDE